MGSELSETQKNVINCGPPFFSQPTATVSKKGEVRRKRHLPTRTSNNRNTNLWHRNPRHEHENDTKGKVYGSRLPAKLHI